MVCLLCPYSFSVTHRQAQEDVFELKHNVHLVCVRLHP